MENILNVNNLMVHFFTKEGVVKAVDDISFKVKQGETLGIAGESGSGKTVAALSITKLISWPPGKIVGGEIFVEDKNILKISNKEMREIRANKVAMIFQDPMNCFNPVLSIGRQIIEAVIIGKKVKKKFAKGMAINLLKEVGIPDPEVRINQYPHEYSGGMLQRAMIAMALARTPKILIADEPTTALDVTIQAQICDLINTLKKQYDSSIIIITHNLGILAEMTENIIVMYAGKILEYGNTETIFYNSYHPYTWGLLKSIPNLYKKKKKDLIPIKGNPPSLLNIPNGCRFSPRCNYAKDICFREIPELKKVIGDHMSACHLSNSKIEKIKLIEA